MRIATRIASSEKSGVELILDTYLFYVNQTQLDKIKMATIHKQFKINASVDQVWEKMSDLSNVHTLFDMLANAELKGDIRVCRTQDGGELKELMVNIDPDQKRLVYTSSLNFVYRSS